MGTDMNQRETTPRRQIRESLSHELPSYEQHLTAAVSAAPSYEQQLTAAVSHGSLVEIANPIHIALTRIAII